MQALSLTHTTRKVPSNANVVTLTYREHSFEILTSLAKITLFDGRMRHLLFFKEMILVSKLNYIFNALRNLFIEVPVVS